MNTLKNKTLAAVFALSSMAAFSTSVQAEEASVDKVLARVVLNQGTRVMNELSTQIQRNVQESLNRFSIDAASWFEDTAALTGKANKQNTSTKSSEE